jgi:hypothetical protein
VKGNLSMTCKIDELIDDNQIASSDFFPQTAAGGCGDDVGDAGLFQGMDICPVIDLCRTELMPLSVPGQMDHVNALDFADRQF